MKKGILIKTYPNHPQNYGFLTDLNHETTFGITPQEHRKYARLYTEWEPYEDEPRRYTGGTSVQYGVLRVYGIPLTCSFDYSI